jgi:hypothetical protein
MLTFTRPLNTTNLQRMDFQFPYLFQLLTYTTAHWFKPTTTKFNVRSLNDAKSRAVIEANQSLMQYNTAKTRLDEVRAYREEGLKDKSRTTKNMVQQLNATSIG